MKIRRGIMAKFLLISIIATSMMPTTNPDTALAASNSLKWSRIETPGAVPDKNDIVSPCEVNKIAIGSDGMTFYSVDIPNANHITGGKALYKSTDARISWSDTIGKNLYQTMTPAEQANFRIWNVATAPDDTNFIAVVTNSNASNLPRNVWLSTNGGDKWQNTNCPITDNISAIDISTRCGSHDIAIGSRTGDGDGTIWILKAAEYDNWVNQGFSGDILSMKFSPNYQSDSTIAIVYTDTTGTYLNVGIHDIYDNTTNWNIGYRGSPPEITKGTTGTSPKANQIISADLELPADFAGQALSLRRYYISIDDSGATGNAGIYRIDGTVIYQLMSATITRRISSIAYHGSYVSGKLLAGEVIGDPCSATVITWFTDSPTTCPIPCWYPALKPLTGAAGTDNCTGSGYGNTQVTWAPDGSTAYAGTASSSALAIGADWPIPYLTGEDLDESAFSITRNNGETWNQLSLIDTQINQFTDIAPAPDCSNVYLASVNDNAGCSGFDSVWRSQSSPIGNIWERVLCTTTTDQGCDNGQTNLAILRLAGDKADGQILCWTAVGTRKMMWSSDFGDYWTNITCSHGLAIQDTAFEDSNSLYILSNDGLAQKFTSSRTGWISQDASYTGIDAGYSIATAYTGLTPDNDKGHVIVGGTGTGIYDVAYSTNGGITFNPITTQLPTRGNTLVVAHSGYKSNGEIFAINNGGMYEWSIYYGGGTWSWPLPEKDKWATQWGGPSWPTPITTLTIARNGSFYFSDAWGAYVRWAWASASLDPSVNFGAEPTTRLRICGSLEYGDPTIIWLIDQRPYNPPQGGVWRYVDDLAWSGPIPTSPITNAPIKHDPVSGRASEIDLTWQPISLSKGYRIQIAKDENFALQIADIGGDWSGPFYTPPDLDSPALVIPPGGGTVTDANSDTWTVPALEAGHSYYWRVMVQNVATGDTIQSPWSWREIFTVKAGLPTTHLHHGPQSLSPDNGCVGCPIKPVSFSWSPFQETEKYKFVLAKNAAMTDIIIEAELPTTGYSYEGTLDYNTIYFWRVMAFEPEPSEWSPTFCFQTIAATPPTSQPPQPVNPILVCLIITVGIILDVVLLIIVISRLHHR